MGSYGVGACLAQQANPVNAREWNSPNVAVKGDIPPTPKELESLLYRLISELDMLCVQRRRLGELVERLVGPEPVERDVVEEGVPCGLIGMLHDHAASFARVTNDIAAHITRLERIV